jgi:hypothetical protein
MAACGQASAHLLHWMQIAGSHTGTSSAMPRFSQRLVAVGHVPSGGKALTGSRSPLPESITDVTRWTKSGASSGTGRGILRCADGSAGTFTSCRFSSARSTAEKFFSTASSPFFE